MTQKPKRQLATRARELLQAPNAERIAFIQTEPLDRLPAGERRA